MITVHNTPKRRRTVQNGANTGSSGETGENSVSSLSDSPNKG